MKIIVCGTDWGRNYLLAIRSRRRKNPSFDLVGIVARGSSSSRKTAAEFNLPLYNSISDVPAVDMACVAVGGEAGDLIALECLQRGIHVLCEHPRKPDFIAEALRCSKSFRAVFHIHGFTETKSVRVFLETCKKAGGRKAARFVSAAGNSRSLYSLVDLMGRAFGTLKPFLFNPAPHGPALEHAKSGRQVFRIVRGQLAGIPATFQSRQSIKDDGWEPVSHHVIVGFPTGNLVMLEAFGPLIWSYRPLYFRIHGLTGTEPMSIQLTSSLTFERWSDLRIRMLARAIESLCKQVKTGKCPNEQRPYHLMQVSSVWERLSADLHGSSRRTDGRVKRIHRGTPSLHPGCR